MTESPTITLTPVAEVLPKLQRKRRRPLTSEGKAMEQELAATKAALDSANRRERRTRIAFLVLVPAVGVGGWLVGWLQ